MTNAIDNRDIMVILRASEAQLISMGSAANNRNQFKASFKLSVMQWAAIIVPEIPSILICHNFCWAIGIVQKCSYEQF